MKRWLDLAALALGLVAAGAYLAPAASRPLTWDEVNYVEAAERGVAANLVDEGAWGPAGYLRYALAKARNPGRADSLAAAAGYTDRGDIIRLRHYHPPGGFLPLIGAVGATDREGREEAARWTQLLWLAALGVVLLLALRAAAPDRPVVRALLVATVLVDPLVRYALLEYHVHVALGMAFVLPVWAGAARRHALLAGAALGALFAVAAMGPAWSVIWLVLLLPFREVRRSLFHVRGVAVAAGAALLTTVLLWPGALLKIGVVQLHGIRLYNLLFQGGEEWSGAGDSLGGLVAAHPAVLLYGAAAVGVYGWALRSLRSPSSSSAEEGRPAEDAGITAAMTAGIAAAGALAFLALILPFAIIVRYLLPLVPLVAVAGGAALATMAPRSGRTVASAVLLLVLLSPRVGGGFPYPSAERSAALVEEYAMVGERLAAGEEILAEFGHIYAAYVEDDANLESAIVDYDGRRLLRRVGVRWDTVAPAGWDRIIVGRRPAGEEPPVMDSLAARCRRVDREVAVHFVCGSGPIP